MIPTGKRVTGCIYQKNLFYEQLDQQIRPVGMFTFAVEP